MEAEHRLMGRADELDLARSANFGEVRILGKEAIAGVDRLDIGDLGGTDDARDIEITFSGRSGADANRLVRKP